MSDYIERDRKRITDCFLSKDGNQNLPMQILDLFPYPIQIFSKDGISRMINKAVLDMIGVKSVESHVGKYNVFEDPIVESLGVKDQIRQVLKGKTIHLTDFSAPYKELIRHFDVEDSDIQIISSDITCFPLVDTEGNIEYFAAVYIYKTYRVKEEVSRGKQYIETHLNEPFDLDDISKAVFLSKSHFIKLFKKHTGLTPHEYYVNCKIDKLKEVLLDTNLSIAQAFEACNMSYNGYYARLFREKVGVTPSEYREMSQ
jgi:AraC family transcriptional regulator